MIILIIFFVRKNGEVVPMESKSCDIDSNNIIISYSASKIANHNKDKGNDKLSTGAIVGFVIYFIVIIVILFWLRFLLVKEVKKLN